ncbi:hypothetical protein ACJX0J_008234, partial [Zea mays]
LTFGYFTEEPTGLHYKYQVIQHMLAVFMSLRCTHHYINKNKKGKDIMIFLLLPDNFNLLGLHPSFTLGLPEVQPGIASWWSRWLGLSLLAIATLIHIVLTEGAVEIDGKAQGQVVEDDLVAVKQPPLSRSTE